MFQELALLMFGTALISKEISILGNADKLMMRQRRVAKKCPYVLNGSVTIPATTRDAVLVGTPALCLRRFCVRNLV